MEAYGQRLEKAKRQIKGAKEQIYKAERVIDELIEATSKQRNEISELENALKGIKLFEVEMGQEETIPIPGLKDDQSTQVTEGPLLTEGIRTEAMQVNPGAMEILCQSSSGSRGQQFRGREGRGQRKESFAGKCHYCKKQGHFARDCRSKQRHRQGAGRGRPVRRNGTVGLRIDWSMISIPPNESGEVESTF
jgi:hypothetical protein